MAGPSFRSRFASVAARLPGRAGSVRTFAILLVVLWYVPWLSWVPMPGPNASADQSWRLALAVACERGLIFGTEIVFPYGPYACYAIWQYWPTTYVPSLVLWAVTSVLVADLALPRPRPYRPLVVALVAVLWLGTVLDAALMALPLTYVLHAYRDRVRTLTSRAALVVMGALALIKISVLPVCVAAAALGAVARGRSVWRDVAIDCSIVSGAIVVAWIGHGQPLTALDDYLFNAVELARGYADAMALPTLVSQPDFEQPLSAQLVVLVTVAAFISCAWPRRSPGGFRAPSLAWAMFALLVLVVAVRQATTRGDGHHFLIGAVFTGAFVLLASTAVSSRARSAALLSFICLGLMPYVGGVQASADLIFRMSSAVQGIAAVIRADDPRRTLDRRLADAVDRARSLARVPGHIDGTFDIVGYDHTLLLALPRSQWAPRPVLQSYAAYTPHLAALNAGHFASGHAPRWVIARVQTIDGRWPMQDDARVWAQLVRHYVAGERLGDYLLLRRRGSNEIERDAVEPVTLDLHLTDWTDVPRPRAGVWYARFALPRACSARLLSSVWKPAACHLEVVVENDPRSYRFRLVRAIAADGFVLSPMIRNTDALEGWLRGGRGHAVARLRLLDDDGRPVPVGVRLTSVPPGWPDPAPVQGPDVPAKVDR